MKTLAIIAEYNPFHNGHLYQLSEAKKIAGCDYSIALMSGNFLQRGEASFWSKYTRSHMALLGGLDLVLELPFCYATGSAHDFAYGAINLLNKLNSVDCLCFGAEHDDINTFYDISEIIINEPSYYLDIMKSNLKKGYSFARARSMAVADYMGNPDIMNILEQSNNILALEYICALKESNSSIEPIIIKRKQANYNDKKIYNSISSATAIRHAINKADISDSFDNIQNDIPATTYELLSAAKDTTFPIYDSDLSNYIINAILSRRSYYANSKLYGDFTSICDINSDINAKLNKLSFPLMYENIIDSLSGKQYTKTRINRALLHLILGYEAAHRTAFINAGYVFYANILGINKSTTSYLKDIKGKSEIPVITKKADFDSLISVYDPEYQKLSSLMWGLDLAASRLYNQIVCDKYGVVLQDDFNINLPVI